MMKLTNRYQIATLLLCSLLATPAIAKKEQLPEITEDGLHLVHDAKLAVVYAEPGANLGPYSRVKMLEPYVAFKKNWLRDQRTSSASPMRVTDKDVEKIKNNLAQEFDTVFRAELEKGGYPVTEEAAEDVLLLRPAIINLDVSAPDTPQAGFSRSYTSSAGEMTLYVELYDSVTGDLIGKAMDRKSDRSNAGYYTWTNSVTNKMAADRILKGWAGILVEALNEARTHASSDAEATATEDE